MKTTTEVAAKTPVPQCGLQGNNLVIAPDKGQTRFTAWIITRDQAGSETMVSNCLEIPMIGIGDTAPPIVKENIVEQFDWINGHPYAGVDYFLQVFAYDDKNVQSEPEEIKLITKQADKPASTTPPSVAEKLATETPKPVQQNPAPQGWVDWMCKWLQMWVVPVLAQLAEKRPSKKTLREIPQFTQNFTEDLNRLKEAHPSDQQVMKVCEMFEKFEISVTELNRMWDEQQKQREEAAKARPVPTPQPAPTPSPEPSPVPTPTPKPTPSSIRTASAQESEQVLANLSDAEESLEAGTPGAITVANTRIADAEWMIERYPDTDAAVIKTVKMRVEEVKNVLATAIEKAAKEEKLAQETLAKQVAEAEEKAAQKIHEARETEAREWRQKLAAQENAREKQARDAAEKAAREAEEKAKKDKEQEQKPTSRSPWYVRFGRRIAIGVLLAIVAAVISTYGVKWWKGRNKEIAQPVSETTDTNAPSVIPPTVLANTNVTSTPITSVETNTPVVAVTSTSAPATSVSSDAGTNPAMVLILNELANIRKEVSSVVVAQATNQVKVPMPEQVKVESTLQGDRNRNVGIGYNSGTIVGGDQINHTYYNGARPGQAGKEINIPAELDCKPSSDGTYSWFKVYNAGEGEAFNVKEGYELRAKYKAPASELTIEVRDHSGKWHVIPTGERLDSKPGSAYRIRMSGNALGTAKFSFHLAPKRP